MYKASIVPYLEQSSQGTLPPAPPSSPPQGSFFKVHLPCFHSLSWRVDLFGGYPSWVLLSKSLNASCLLPIITSKELTRCDLILFGQFSPIPILPRTFFFNGFLWICSFLLRSTQFLCQLVTDEEPGFIPCFVTLFPFCRCLFRYTFDSLTSVPPSFRRDNSPPVFDW